MEKVKEELMKKTIEVLAVLKPLIILSIIYIVLHLISFLMLLPIILPKLQN